MYFDRVAPSLFTPFEQIDPALVPTGHAELCLLDRVIAQEKPAHDDLSLLSAPFVDRTYQWPGLLFFHPPTFYVIMMVGKVEWILNLCQIVPEQFEGLLALRDSRGRNAVHFASSCGKFARLFHALENARYRGLFSADANRPDAQGLLARIMPDRLTMFRCWHSSDVAMPPPQRTPNDIVYSICPSIAVNIP
jgi:hypothetical protein